MECFIYAITNTVTGRRYIGSCVKVKRRFGEHRSALKHNKHHCSYLQNSYNKHGKENFTFSIIRVLTINDRKARAVAELEEIAKAPCFNSLQAQTNLQFFTSSEEIRLKISESGKQRYQDRPEIAQKHSAFMKIKMSDPILRAKLSESVKAAHTEEVRKKKSEAAKRSWASGERRPRPIRILSPEEIQSKAEKMKAFWASPEGQLTKVKQKAAVQAYFANKRAQKAIAP